MAIVKAFLPNHEVHEVTVLYSDGEIKDVPLKDLVAVHPITIAAVAELYALSGDIKSIFNMGLEVFATSDIEAKCPGVYEGHQITFEDAASKLGVHSYLYRGTSRELILFTDR